MKRQRQPLRQPAQNSCLQGRVTGFVQTSRQMLQHSFEVDSAIAPVQCQACLRLTIGSLTVERRQPPGRMAGGPIYLSLPAARSVVRGPGWSARGRLLDTITIEIWRPSELAIKRR